jgi:radical SAM protein with 4Fe4S-binding SPASM domain
MGTSVGKSASSQQKSWYLVKHSVILAQQKVQLPDICYCCPWRFACQGGCQNIAYTTG